MSDSFESLARHVSPAVVEVLVTGFGSDDENDKGSGAVGRERSLGSGVIIDSSGYIVTNHHVVEGAERVRVIATTARPKRVRLKEVRYTLTLVEQGLPPGALAEDQITVQQDNFMPGASQGGGCAETDHSCPCNDNSH
jgi:hypothetical protein